MYTVGVHLLFFQCKLCTLLHECCSRAACNSLNKNSTFPLILQDNQCYKHCFGMVYSGLCDCRSCKLYLRSLGPQSGRVSKQWRVKRGAASCGRFLLQRLICIAALASQESLLLIFCDACLPSIPTEGAHHGYPAATSSIPG